MLKKYLKFLYNLEPLKTKHNYRQIIQNVYHHYFEIHLREFKFAPQQSEKHIMETLEELDSQVHSKQRPYNNNYIEY
jgi:hypothetical protein